MKKFNNEKIQHVIQVNSNFTNVNNYNNVLWKVNDNLFFNIANSNTSHDVNGNPLYKIVIVDGDMNIINEQYKKSFYRNYSDYSIIQSYSISDDMRYILRK